MYVVPIMFASLAYVGLCLFFMSLSVRNLKAQSMLLHEVWDSHAAEYQDFSLLGIYAVYRFCVAYFTTLSVTALYNVDK